MGQKKRRRICKECSIEYNMESGKSYDKARAFQNAREARITEETVGGLIHPLETMIKTAKLLSLSQNLDAGDRELAEIIISAGRELERNFAKLENTWLQQPEEDEQALEEPDYSLKENSLRALVVDDNELNRMMASEILRRLGIEVGEASSGEQAVAMYRRLDYDYIFMDYLMPGMDGASAVEELKKVNKGKEAVLIALLADDTEEIKDKFLKAGVSHIWKKPLTLKDLEDLEGLEDLPEAFFSFWKPSFLTEENRGGGCPEKERERTRSRTDTTASSDWEDVFRTMYGNLPTNKIRKACARNLRGQIQKIITNGEVGFRESRICFHSLKGIFLNIGASKLAKEAELWEKESRKPDGGHQMQKLSSFCRQVESLACELEPTVLPYGERNDIKEKKEETELSKEVFGQYLNIVRQRLAMYEMNDVAYLMEKMMSIPEKEKRDKIEQAGKYIHEFDYERALDALDGL